MAGCRSRANGAARCNAVALVVMQAGRVSPARTRTAAESTTSPIVAAVSTDIDGNGSRLNGRPTDTAHANRSRHRKGLPCVICGAVGVGVAVAGCRYSTRQSVLPPKRLPRVCVLCGCCGSSSSCCYIRPSAARLLRAVASWLRAGDTTGLLPRRAATTQHSTSRSVGPATEGRRCWLLCVLSCAVRVAHHS